MAQDLRKLISRSRDTILSDALGAASLIVLLLASLSLPSLV